MRCTSSFLWIGNDGAVSVRNVGSGNFLLRS